MWTPPRNESGELTRGGLITLRSTLTWLKLESANVSIRIWLQFHFPQLNKCLLGPSKPFLPLLFNFGQSYKRLLLIKCGSAFAASWTLCMQHIFSCGKVFDTMSWVTNQNSKKLLARIWTAFYLVKHKEKNNLIVNCDICWLFYVLLHRWESILIICSTTKPQENNLGRSKILM
jgi:hypothetical protein